MNNSSAKSKLTKADVKYFDFGRTHTFDLKQTSCTSAINLQNVEMLLICEGKTGTRYTFKKWVLENIHLDLFCLDYLYHFFDVLLKPN